MEGLGTPAAEEDSWIQYSIFLPSSSEFDIEKWRIECVELLLPHTEGYLWHMEPFCLRTPDPSDPDYVASSELLLTSAVVVRRPRNTDLLLVSQQAMTCIFGEGHITVTASMMSGLSSIC